MDRGKTPVYGRNLDRVFAGRADTSQEHMLFATFSDVWGIAPLTGRRLQLTVTFGELAKMLGAIQALRITDDADIAAMGRVLRLLRRLNGDPDRFRCEGCGQILAGGETDDHKQRHGLVINIGPESAGGRTGG